MKCVALATLNEVGQTLGGMGVSLMVSSGQKEALVNRHFAKPEGFVGALAGRYMARESFEINAWAVSHLALEPTEHVLEIGFGPGLAIREIADRIPEGRVVGLDHAPLMQAVAEKHNREAVDAGRVVLLAADVMELPRFDRGFDKILSVNSVMYWPDLDVALSELRRVLQPQGRLVLVIQRPLAMASEAAFHEEVGTYCDALRHAGYGDISVSREVMKTPIHRVCVGRCFQLSPGEALQTIGVAIHATRPEKRCVSRSRQARWCKAVTAASM